MSLKKISIISFVIFVLGISVFSLQQTNAGGRTEDFLGLSDITGTFSTQRRNYRIGDTVNGELTLNNAGRAGSVEVIYQTCFDAVCRRKLLPLMNLKPGKNSIPISLLIDKKFKTINISVLLAANNINQARYDMKTFTYNIGKKRRARPVLSAAELSAPFLYESTEAPSGFCPLKAEAIKQACHIPDELEVFKADAADCLFGVRHADDSTGTLVDFYFGKTYFLFTGKYIPYSNDELREERLDSPLNKNGTLEDIAGLGDTAFVIKRPINDDQRSGSMNYQFGLYAKYKKLFPQIISAGSNLGSGYGCDVDEVKDLMKNTVFSVIDRLK